MENVIEFLKQLQRHNDRAWFEANKAWYRNAQSEFHSVVEELIDRIARFDPSVLGLAAKDCTYRIHRDIRFSANKAPYKTHMGAYICRGGKKSGFSGYYFHVEPEGDHLGGHMLSAGIYMPERDVLESIREEILDHGASFEESIRRARGFRLYQGNKLKKSPAGFPSTSAYSDYLKLKDFYLEKFVGDDYMLQPDLARKAAADFERTLEFNERLNRAVAYALENR